MRVENLRNLENCSKMRNLSKIAILGTPLKTPNFTLFKKMKKRKINEKNIGIWYPLFLKNLKTKKIHKKWKKMTFQGFKSWVGTHKWLYLGVKMGEIEAKSEKMGKNRENCTEFPKKDQKWPKNGVFLKPPENRLFKKMNF